MMIYYKLTTNFLFHFVSIYLKIEKYLNMMRWGNTYGAYCILWWLFYLEYLIVCGLFYCDMYHFNIIFDFYYPCNFTHPLEIYLFVNGINLGKFFHLLDPRSHHF